MTSSWSCTLLLLLAHSFPLSTPAAIKAGYWPSYRNESFPASSIDLSLFTHVYYAFVQPDPATFRLNITPFDSDNIPAFVAAAHAHIPPAKALLSVADTSSSRPTLAGLVADQANRAVFINSAIAVARWFGLDGLDLDWEFPTDGGQMSGLAQLFVEWRAAVESDAATSGRPKLLLSAAVYYASSLGSRRPYPAVTMARTLDWINAMCYDYRGGWNTSETGEPAALYDPKSNVSTSYGIESWIAAGVPAQKIVVGIPLYGHSWTLKNASDNGIGAPAVAVGPGRKGVIIYSAIVEFNKRSNAMVVYDAMTVSVYAYAGTSWIGYDDTRSVEAKVEFAKARELGGYFFWALGYDDSSWSISRRASSAWEA